MSQDDTDYENNWEIQEEEDEEAEGGEDESEEDEDEDNAEGEEEAYGDYEIDDDDDDDINPPPGDYDDPQYTGVDPRGQPAEYYQPEYNPDEEANEFKDEPEEERKNDRYGNRGAMIFAILCCCCLILVAIALILVFLVFKKDGDSSPSGSNNSGPSSPAQAPTNPATFPTMPPKGGAPIAAAPFSYPTVAPVTPPPTGSPTLVPTISSQPTQAPIDADPIPQPTKFPTTEPTISPAPTQAVPDGVELIPIEDTYIVDGFAKFEAHGEEQTFLVQNALDHVNEVPDAFALLKFDLSGIPFARIQNRELSALLELTHEVSVLDRGPATYTVERLPSTPLAVESLHLGVYPLPVDGIKGPTFDVAPSDETVVIDVTELFFGGSYEPADDDQALLMIANYGIEQDAGDRFKTREAVGEEPKLRIVMTRVPGVPDSTAPPVPPPTLAPTVTVVETSAPTTNTTNADTAASG